MTKRLPLSPRGAALAGGSIALITGGMVIADGFLIVIGLSGIILLGAAWILALASLKKISVNLYMPTRVSAGIPFDVELNLQNHRLLLDAFNLEIQLRLLGITGKKNNDACVEAIAPWIASGSASQIKLPATLRSRGFSSIHPITLSTSFPLGLFRLQKKSEIHHEVTVTPRPITPIELNRDGSMHDALPRDGASAGQNSGEPRGIRPWQAGDSAKHIHWPASARALAIGHSLRVREYDPPGFHPDHCHLVFHSYASGGELLREDRFERALSLLAGALNELQSNGIPCQLTADFLMWDSIPCSSRTQFIQCLCRLASVQRAQGTEAHDLEATLRGVSPEHTLMIISDMPPESWQHLLSKHPHTLIVDIRQVRYHNKTLHAAIA